MGVVWARVVFVTRCGAEATIGTVGVRRPDLATVDALARLQLAARRLGGSLRLRDVGDELGELLDLVGLRREVGGQSEGREEVLGVEEGVEPGDSLA